MTTASLLQAFSTMAPPPFRRPGITIALVRSNRRELSDSAPLLQASSSTSEMMIRQSSFGLTGKAIPIPADWQNGKATGASVMGGYASSTPSDVTNFPDGFTTAVPAPGLNDTISPGSAVCIWFTAALAVSSTCWENSCNIYKHLLCFGKVSSFHRRSDRTSDSDNYPIAFYLDDIVNRIIADECPSGILISFGLIRLLDSPYHFNLITFFKRSGRIASGARTGVSAGSDCFLVKFRLRPDY